MKSEYLWIIEDTIEAWIAKETYMVLSDTVFISETEGPRGAFIRYVEEADVLTIDGYPVDVGDYLPQFLGIIDAVFENNGKVTTIRQGE
jgi:hypothetical protein